jgi:hypothetical protein
MLGARLTPLSLSAGQASGPQTSSLSIQQMEVADLGRHRWAVQPYMGIRNHTTCLDITCCVNFAAGVLVPFIMGIRDATTLANSMALPCSTATLC